MLLGTLSIISSVLVGTADDVFIVRYTTHINKSTANCTYNFEEK